MDKVWAIVQLFGHKTLAGEVSPDETFGEPMLRIDIPPVDGTPAFTELYGVKAIYGISYVSEEVARLTAGQLRATPLHVYAPALITEDNHRAATGKLIAEIERLRRRAQLTGPAVEDELLDF